MAGDFDIDEGWTGKESSGGTSLEGCTRRVAVEPGCDSSPSLAKGASLGRTTRGMGAIPDAGRLVTPPAREGQPPHPLRRTHG
jgi:hypothetical protein